MAESDSELQIIKKRIFSFVVVRNPIEKFFLKYFFFIIPGIYLFRSLLQFIHTTSVPNAFFDFVKIPSELALMIALGCSSILFRDTQILLIQLLHSKSIVKLSSNGSDLEDRINLFLSKSDWRLNQGLRIWIGLISSILVFIYYILRLGGISQFLSFINRMGFSFFSFDLFLYIFPSVMYAYFAGVIVWKFVITSLIIKSIPTNFDIQAQFGHPDGVGGLLPIGRICLSMFYVAVVPTIISALILIAPFFTPEKIHTHIVANKVALFSLVPFGLLIGIVGSFISLKPLFKYHTIMKNNKFILDVKINKISQKIIELKEQLYDHLFQENLDGSDLVESKLNTLNKMHDEYNQLGTWPINRKMIVKIWMALSFLLGQLSLFINFVNNFAVF